MAEPNGDGFLTEEQLKRMSRNIKTALPLSESSERSEIQDDHINIWRETTKNLLLVASRTDLGATHRVAAWNTLCAVVDQCAGSVDRTLQRVLLWEDELWYKLLHLYLSQSHNARPKSAKQLLSTLSSTWLKTEDLKKDESVVAEQLLTIIVDTDDERKIKAGLQALTHFLAKQVVLLSTLLQCRSADVETLSNAEARVRLQNLLGHLFQLAGGREVGSITGQLVTVLLDQFDALEYENRSQCHADTAPSDPIWALPLRRSLDADSTLPTEIRLHIFPVLFKRRALDYFAFLHSNGLDGLIDGRPGPESGSQFDEILCAALQSGKELGLLDGTDDKVTAQTSKCMSIPVQAVSKLLQSQSSTARLTGLSFIITSHSSTRALSARALQILKRHFHVFMGDTDANLRGEVFGLMQKLMERLRAVTHALQKQADSGSVSTSAIQPSHSFMKWLLRFLESELRPTANYQHHISALRCLSAVVRSGIDQAVPASSLSKSAATGASRWPFDIPIMTPALRRLLLDLVMDPFDDVRQASASILRIYSGTHNSEHRADLCDRVGKAIDRAENAMLVSGRADQADGVAQLYALLYRQFDNLSSTNESHQSLRSSIIVHLTQRLEQMLALAKSDLATATSKYPLHGLFTSLRYVKDQPDSQYSIGDIPARLNRCLHQVWETVRSILCNDAPEGYVPEDSVEAMANTSKDTLSYCWRALKESSLLMATIVADKNTSFEHVLSLSDLCFSQLAELRHRGAFSTVAQTWVACCIRCRNISSGDTQTLANKWYVQIQHILDERTIINTRRSAGLPSLVCGLLIADETGQLMARTFKDFTTIAQRQVDAASENESSLSQVHALNCIKDVLKNTRLGEQSERYIAHSLILAAESLRSRAWAVRNCGLMLFRAVIDRLLGTSEAHLDDDRPASSRLAIDQHPELLPVVLDLLRAPAARGSGGNEGIFPALQLLQNMELPQDLRSRAEDAVFELTVNPSWHIRQKAAWVFVMITDSDEALRKIETVLTAARCSTNACHGALLCLKRLIVQTRNLNGGTHLSSLNRAKLEREGTSTAQLDRLNMAMTAVTELHCHSICPVIKAECIEVWTEWTQASIRGNESQNRLEQENQEGKDPPQPNSNVTVELDRMRNKPLSGDAIVRRSIANALAIQIRTSLFGTIESLRTRILSLKENDENACAVFFGQLQRTDAPGSLNLQMQKLLLGIAKKILEDSCTVHLKCVVQAFLVYLNDSDCIAKEVTSEFCDVITASIPPVSSTANQRYADHWLQLEAIAMENGISSMAIEESVIPSTERLSYWLSSCCGALRDEQTSLFSREAAALAISRISIFWSHLQRTNSAGFQSLSLATYDLLNDDDEDLRTLAAGISRRVIQTVAGQHNDGILEPAEARSTLMRFFVKQWPSDTVFVEEALARAFGLNPNQQLSVAEQLQKAANISTALFAEEKQNLYIDEGVEAKAWSSLLLQLDISAISAKGLHSLTSWVSESLDSVLEKASREADGPLGWSTKPETFVLGLQIIYGTEVLLYAAVQGIRLPMRPSMIRSKLAALNAALVKASANDLWLREIERVASKAVVSNAALTGNALEMILKCLDAKAS